ncbi:MAG: ankyrin repeat domain-containing protein [Gemmatimonadaceae bacterium]|nr:ankyrin repeat domain-containing protein [Gemmatimonadaceae bacterium]
MDTLPLPPRPDLRNYRKRAKSLKAAAASHDPQALTTWASHWLTALTRALGWELTPFIRDSFDRAVAHLAREVDHRRTQARERGETFSLSDAQQLIAQAHGYESWAEFGREVEAMRSEHGQTDFERAADAVVNGDLATLDRLLTANPGLARDRSSRKHRATLLHYVAANGVEDFRQKSPPGAVAVALRLLEAGAVVDALAETYGGGTYQTPLNLLVSSTHPAVAGLQSQLAEVLIDHGAAIDGVAGDSSPLMTALAFGYLETAETLVRRGARISNVAIAAALGRLDLVREWVVDRFTLSRREPLRVPYWVRIPADAPGQIAAALVLACRFGHEDVARFLLDLGVDPASADHQQMSALHWASASGLPGVVDRLLSMGAPLEARNTWGGTVLDSTVWFARHAPVAGVDYAAMVRRLLDAGADPGEVHPFPTGDPVLDKLLGDRVEGSAFRVQGPEH